MGLRGVRASAQSIGVEPHPNGDPSARTDRDVRARDRLARSKFRVFPRGPHDGRNVPASWRMRSFPPAAARPSGARGITISTPHRYPSCTRESIRRCFGRCRLRKKSDRRSSLSADWKAIRASTCWLRPDAAWQRSIQTCRFGSWAEGTESVIRELRQKAIAAGHPNMIDLPGYVAREQLPEFLSRAHVFAAPSEYEGGPGFVYLEAMACGLPVVACDGSGASEVIENGVTGFLVPPRNVDALHDVLDRLLSDESLRTEMGRRAREYVEREANSNDCLRRLEAFYCEVAQRCQRSPAYV